MIRNVLKFFDNITTKKTGTEEYTPIYVPNKYETCLKGDIAEIYISSEGDDNNSGLSVEKPIATLDKGFQIMKDYGFASVHFYFLTATNFYMTNYKNVSGCSIHFHTRADGVNLHIVNTDTAQKHEYDYTAFYGNHYNFGNGRKITPGDDYNITQKMNVIFHSNERASYFEGGTVIFSACRIFQNNASSSALNASNASEHLLYPLQGKSVCTAFGGCSRVDFNQCWIYDEISINESNAYFMDCTFYARRNADTFIYARNSNILFRMGHSGASGSFVSPWEGSSLMAGSQNRYYQILFHNNIPDTNPVTFYSINTVLFGLNSNFGFYDGIGIALAGSSAGSTNQINRVVTLRNSTMTANTIPVAFNNKNSSINTLNFYNSGNMHTVNQNSATCSTVNGIYANAKTGDLGE